nr:MAG TPA: hypothetical protein [Caudoviricetes sp.]
MVCAPSAARAAHHRHRADGADGDGRRRERLGRAVAEHRVLHGRDRDTGVMFWPQTLSASRRLPRGHQPRKKLRR